MESLTGVIKDSARTPILFSILKQLSSLLGINIDKQTERVLLQ